MHQTSLNWQDELLERLYLLRWNFWFIYLSSNSEELTPAMSVTVGRHQQTFLNKELLEFYTQIWQKIKRCYTKTDAHINRSTLLCTSWSTGVCVKHLLWHASVHKCKCVLNMWLSYLHVKEEQLHRLWAGDGPKWVRFEWNHYVCHTVLFVSAKSKRRSTWTVKAVIALGAF